MADLVGRRLGQYQIVSELGQGGMATVYKAWQASMNRDVAIKVITGQMADNRDFIARFEREVRLIAQLQHPHILPVYDFGSEGKLIYLVMRLVEGGSLDQRLRQGPLEIKQAVRMITQIASALNFAHDQGIIHRDLKPNNILLDKKNNPYLMDFGIAKMVEGQTRLTATGTVMGTPAYMAPEQWRAETLDLRADIYALGIMLYEMLTGELPFTGDTPYSLMYQHLDAPRPSLITRRPDIPEGVGDAIQKAMAKNKEDRYPSAEQFAEDVNAALAGPPTAASRPVESKADRFDRTIPEGAPTAPGIAEETASPSPTATPARQDRTMQEDIPTAPPLAPPTRPAAPDRPIVNTYIAPDKELPRRARGVPTFAIAGVVVVALIVLGALGLPRLLAPGPTLTLAATATVNPPTNTAVAMLATTEPTQQPVQQATRQATQAATSTEKPTDTPTQQPTEKPSDTAVAVAAKPTGTEAATTTTAPSATLTDTTVPPTATTPPTTLPITAAPNPTAGATLTEPATSPPATAQATAAPATSSATGAAATVAPAAGTAVAGTSMLIFRSDDTLTLYIASKGFVSLDGITIESESTQGQRLTRRLDQFPSFMGLPFNHMPSPTCFQLQSRQRSAPVPIECRQIPPTQFFIEKLTPANMIWYDSVVGEPRQVFITRNSQLLGVCPVTLAQCEIVIPDQ